MLTQHVETDLALEVEVGKMNSGQSFGELALIYDQPRSASILAQSDCHFGVLGKEDYAYFLEKDQSAEFEKINRILRLIDMFSGWDYKRLSTLCNFWSYLDVIRN